MGERAHDGDGGAPLPMGAGEELDGRLPESRDLRLKGLADLVVGDGVQVYGTLVGEVVEQVVGLVGKKGLGRETGCWKEISEKCPLSPSSPPPFSLTSLSLSIPSLSLSLSLSLPLSLSPPSLSLSLSLSLALSLSLPPPLSLSHTHTRTHASTHARTHTHTHTHNQ